MALTIDSFIFPAGEVREAYYGEHLRKRVMALVGRAGALVDDEGCARTDEEQRAWVNWHLHRDMAEERHYEAARYDFEGEGSVQITDDQRRHANARAESYRREYRALTGSKPEPLEEDTTSPTA